MAQLGLTPAIGSAYNLVLDVATVAVFLFVALMLFWRRSDEPGTRLASLMLVTVGAANSTTLYNALVGIQPAIFCWWGSSTRCWMAASPRAGRAPS